jgi:PST family polysaccharide transporter
VKNKFLKNTSWLFFDKILKISVGLFVTSWVARFLGPKDYGVLNYSLAYISLFALFTKIGLDQIVVRELVKKPHLTDHLLGTTFVLKFFGSLIAIIFILISLWIVKTDQLTRLVILIMSIGLIFQSFDAIDYYYQSIVLSKYAVIARSCAFLLTSLLQIYLIVQKNTTIYFATAFSINFILVALLFLYVYRRTGHYISHWRFNIQKARELLLYSWPLAVSAFLISIHARIDQVMIGNILDTEQVGIYSVAVIISEFWYFIPALLASSLMPYYVKLRENNTPLYELRLIQLYSLMFWMGVVAGVFVLIFGKQMITLVFGNTYGASYNSLVINIWNGIFISQAAVRGIWMISENLQRYRLYNNLIVVTFNILLNYFLIPALGITGAAIATLVTQSLGTWGISLLWKPFRKSTMDLIKASNPYYVYKLSRSL